MCWKERVCVWERERVCLGKREREREREREKESDISLVTHAPRRVLLVVAYTTRATPLHCYALHGIAIYSLLLVIRNRTVSFDVT